MPRCKCTRGFATEPYTYPDGHTGFICKRCLESIKFKNMGKEERIAYLKQLDHELTVKGK